MGVAVGVLVTVILVLIVIIVFILYKNYKSNSSYPSGSPYYGTGAPRFDHLEAQWAERKVTLGRQLPPTPTTSEEQYTDSSAEYSSPLLTTNPARHAQRVHTNTKTDISWESFFPYPPPPSATPPTKQRLGPVAHVAAAAVLTPNRSIYGQPVSHYAATDVVNPNGSPKIYGKSGRTYFL